MQPLFMHVNNEPSVTVIVVMGCAIPLPERASLRETNTLERIRHAVVRSSPSKVSHVGDRWSRG